MTREASLPRRWYSGAYVTLLDALAEHAQRGDFPECHGSDAWLSENPDTRAEAARWCAPCIVLDLCAAAARELRPTHGVFAGRDWTKRGAVS